MKSIDVSVIIPCYNHGHYLVETLQCFPTSTTDHDRYELIIVNDGSTDHHTLAVLKDVEEKGIRVIHQQNQGLSSARNTGISAAQGRYILPLDSDDKISLDFIYEAIEILDADSSYAVVYSDGEYFDAKTGPWIVGEFNLQRLMLWNYLHAGAVFRKEAWERAGGYDTNLNYLGFEDWDLWLAIAFSGGKFFYLQKPLFSYRITENSMVRQFTSETYDKMLAYIRTKWHAYLSREYLTERLAINMKLNKRLWFKLFIRIYFPKILTKLVDKGKIDSPHVFY